MGRVLKQVKMFRGIGPGFIFLCLRIPLSDGRQRFEDTMVWTGTHFCSHKSAKARALEMLPVEGGSKLLPKTGERLAQRLGLVKSGRCTAPCHE